MATTITPISLPMPTSITTNHIHNCQRCAAPYDWRRSHSNLKMTWCGILCEIADLGFSLETIC